MTAAELAAIKPGDVIYLGVLGSAANQATVTTARIRVTVGNNAVAPFALSDEAGATVAGTSPPVFYRQYTVPAGVSTYSLRIDAEVYSPQFDNNTNPWDTNLGWR